MRTIGVGVIGCGNISDIYLKNITKMFKNVELICIADLDTGKAAAQAEKYETKAVTTEALLADEAVEIVLNITTPKSHRKVCEMALNAGKHVYVEKPLSLTVEDGQFLVDLAKEKGLYIGGAPDTFLGAGIQTCRKLIEDGWIGDIVGANAFLLCHGHESWHPSPEFYYEVGGGPMYDMGPYYITALVALLGEIETVAGMTKKGFETRTITSEPKFGKVIEVEVPTHLTSLLRFRNGAIGQLTTSFDVWKAEVPKIEIYGTKGSISVPDPNTFGGPVKLMTEFDKEYREVPMAFGYGENSRGLGISQMADAIINDDPSLFEANGDMTFHVLKVMDAVHVSSDSKQFVEID